MKTHSVTTYTATELREQFPEGFESALQRWQERMEIFWQDEIIESLKACCEAAGVNLRDWNLGAYSRNNHISVSFPQDGAEELSGKRAFAWLENNLFGPLRLSFTATDRWKLAKYNRGMTERFYTAGRVLPCPLTGYCADDDYLNALRERVRKGDTLKEAFENLADVCQRLLEAECEDQNTPDYFCEHADANGYEFTEDGEQF